MKHTSIALCLLATAFICGFSAKAEEKAKPLKYSNALEYRMINNGFSQSQLEAPYQRLPKAIKDSVRQDLWSRQKCCSGEGIRFSTNSSTIALRVEPLWNFTMNHMAYTGIRGVDLYCRKPDGTWEYVNATRPKNDKVNDYTLVSNMTDSVREFLLYLPLYDGLKNLEIGVDSTAVIGQPKINSPRKEKKIVLYGTSITQGGCATRTGMVASNMISRDLDVEVVNLGFSGEGKLDMILAKTMASIADADVFIIDCIPNCTYDMLTTLTFPFVEYLHKTRPEVPIVMVEGLIYPYAKYDEFFKKYLPKKNNAFHDAFVKMKKSGVKNIYYVNSDHLVGDDNEGTVDGIHMTDIGFRRWADKLIPVLRPLVK